MIRSLHRLITALALCLPAAPSLAADFPASDRPITIVLGFPAGGGMDGVARALQPSMEQTLGTKIVIDYRTGAGGNIASQLVANARPDGHTLLLGTAATHGVNATLYKRLPFDVEADFTPIAPILDAPNVLAINPSAIGARTVKEFIDQVKANPGKYNYASTGYGTSTHLAFADFAARAGLDMVHVPFKGGPDAMIALMRGDVCCIFTQVQLVLQQAQAGKVRLLGVSTRNRVPSLPEVPTIAEAAIPGFENSLWFGLFGPKGMDPAAVRAINRAVKVALETPSVRQRLTDLGNTPRYETPEEFRATVKADRAKWAAIVKASGATID
ncbi:MAG: tripartite tricarboxylate transporter substrate binding protein [Burkholderiaceae bacterium]|nr:tripartite tricarboxylate transporter substrate binding protein [Burkholderiaceae bacterium]